MNIIIKGNTINRAGGLMKLKKLIFSFAIIILILQSFTGIICNATEDEGQRVILNDFSELEEDNNKLNIYSEAAILIDAQTGKILYNKDIYSRKYPASTTKILTAIIALEQCNLEDKATASHDAIFSVKSGYSIANIQEGESFTIRELLDVLMLQSANEAANIIAEHISGSVKEFSKLMNEKAKEIGCLDSNFINANGAHNENHYSTAYDLAMIAKYCMENETFRELAKKQECRLPATEIFEEERIFRNTNSLMQANSRYYYPYCNGIKTGFTTPAKNCLISSSNKDGFELISVVLHAESTEEGLSARYIDTINLFEYGYNNYNKDEILKEYNLLGTTNNLNNNQNKWDKQVVKKEDVATIETVTEAVKKDYNMSEKNTYIIGWIEIILGLSILMAVGKSYLIKKMKENVALKKIRDLQEKEMHKDNLYNFKLI